MEKSPKKKNHHAVQKQIRTISCRKKEITDEKEINNELFKFYKALFEPKINVSNALIQDYLNRIEIPKLTKEQSRKCEGEITEEELLKALKKMPKNKSPGNDGITKEFYEAFWDDMKTLLLLSLKKAFKVGELSISQKQALIKLIEKKDKDKRQIKNWRPISLLNVDTKLVSKALAEPLKTALPSLVSSNQTAYLNGRFISEGRCLISDIFEVSDLLKLKGLLLKVDIKKDFDSVNHNFLLKVLKNESFGHYFLKWISIFLQNQESCVINRGKTTRYVPLKKGARQDDPISTLFFYISFHFY